jgi:hypothetical protein
LEVIDVDIVEAVFFGLGFRHRHDEGLVIIVIRHGGAALIDWRNRNAKGASDGLISLRSGFVFRW